MLPTELWPSVTAREGTFTKPLATLMPPDDSITNRTASSAITTRPGSGAGRMPAPREIRQAGLSKQPLAGYSYATPHRNDLLSAPNARGSAGRKMAAGAPVMPSLSAPSTRTAVYPEASNPPQAANSAPRY